MSKRVLVVDDDEDMVALFVHVLKRVPGLQVTGTTCPKQALQTLAEFDVLVTDYTMGGMTGVQLAKAYKAARPDGVAVMVTGRYGVDAGNDVDAMLMKPLETSTLIAEVCRSARVAA